jgi:hypothetical protein
VRIISDNAVYYERAEEEVNIVGRIRSFSR